MQDGSAIATLQVVQCMLVFVFLGFHFGFFSVETLDFGGSGRGGNRACYLRIP